MTTILAVNGSLQSRSSNGALLRAFVAKLGADAVFTRALHELPPFNTDTDTDNPSASVVSWRSELARAHGVVFATPEYAFGIPGALKNALDWVVGSGEFVNKPVALLAASTLETGAGLALEALDRTIRVMSADVVGTLSIPFVRAKLDENGNVVDAETDAALTELAHLFRGVTSDTGRSQ